MNTALRLIAFRLAAVPIPHEGFKVPQASTVINAGLREFDRLYAELVSAIAKGASRSTINALRIQILSLNADLRTAGRILGMLSPWQPRVNTWAEPHVKPDPLPPEQPITLASKRGITLASSAKRWRFPWIQDALDFLFSKKVVTATEFAKMAAADKKHVFSAPGIDSTATLINLQKKLGKSLEEGASLSTFRKEIAGETSLARFQTETLYRTETKRGYVAGFDKALKSPLVAAEFPAVLYSATPDQRVRDEHWDLDGYVILRKDRQAYKVFRNAADDYNCRCSLTPLDLAEAESRGISSYSDLPLSARQKYG